MDENNQYGFAITKPLSYGCIKKKKHVPSLEELTELLKSVNLDDKLGHLFIVDIKFEDVNKRTLLLILNLKTLTRFILRFLKRIKRSILTKDHVCK